MRNPIDSRSRRLFLGTLGAAFFTTRGLFAEQLMRTPPLTEGPFYPDKLPLDTDNDLIIVKDHITPAVGEITHLTGRILGPNGTPVRDALVEIWQCDANEVYLHSARQRHDPEPAGQEFPGLRPVHDGFDRRVSLPHHQAGPLSRPARSPHPLQDQARGSRAAHDPVDDRRPLGQ